MIDQKQKLKERTELFDKLWDDFCENFGNGYDKQLAKHFFVLGYNHQYLVAEELRNELELNNG